VHFQTRAQQSSVPEPANASPTSMAFTVLFLRMNTGIYLLIWHLQKKQWKNNLWMSQCLNKQVHPRVELSVPVEISSSSGTQSPSAGHTETSTPVEVNPSPPQPEALELPATASTPSYSEASALPGKPPSPVVAPKQSPGPAQEIRHEALICA
jgi:hypothetical protein